MARGLGIEGVNPGGTLSRIEVGSRQPDADMIERIALFTGGAVGPADMHQVRLAWLRANRPEKFGAEAPPPSSLRAATSPPHGGVEDGSAAREAAE